jgi:hypothetical protein
MKLYIFFQNPEAANLFSNLRRPYRPSIWQEWRKTWVLSIIGVGMVIFGFGSVVWNEVKHKMAIKLKQIEENILIIAQGRAVQTARSLDEGHRNLIIPETNDVVFEENNGKLVLVADHLKIQDSLADDKYGISIQAVKLKKVKVPAVSFKC